MKQEDAEKENLKKIVERFTEQDEKILSVDSFNWNSRANQTKEVLLAIFGAVLIIIATLLLRSLYPDLVTRQIQSMMVFVSAIIAGLFLMKPLITSNIFILAISDRRILVTNSTAEKDGVVMKLGPDDIDGIAKVTDSSGSTTLRLILAPKRKEFAYIDHVDLNGISDYYRLEDLCQAKLGIRYIR